MDNNEREKIASHIKELRRMIEQLAAAGADAPCLASNTARMEASLRMMEMDLGLLFTPYPK